MRNWIILTVLSLCLVSCGCEREKSNSKNDPNSSSPTESAQQKNLPAEGFNKSHDNSNSGLPRRLADREVSDRCLELGETATQAGELPIKDLKRKCCKGLVDKVSVDVCGKGIAGGYIYACVNCGDGKCDSNYESKCNCPEDCK